MRPSKEIVTTFFKTYFTLYTGIIIYEFINSFYIQVPLDLHKSHDNCTYDICIYNIYILSNNKKNRLTTINVNVLITYYYCVEKYLISTAIQLK